MVWQMASWTPLSGSGQKSWEQYKLQIGLGGFKGGLGPVDRLSCLTTCQLGENLADERLWQFGFPDLL